MRKSIVIGPIIAIALWWAISISGLVDRFLLPDPLLTFTTLVSMFGSTLGADAVATLGRTFLGFGLAVLVGLPLGLALGKAEHVYRSVEIVIDFVRSIPPTALLPPFLLFFGIGDASKVALAAFGAGTIIVFNTAYGVINSNKARILAAKLMGASTWQVFRLIMVWESLPQIMVGLRTAVSWSIAIIVVAEMWLGTSAGVGRRIIDTQTVFNIPAMYASILLAGFLGYMLNLILLQVERRLVHWKLD